MKRSLRPNSAISAIDFSHFDVSEHHCPTLICSTPSFGGGGAMVWVNFQCGGVLLIWIRVGQGPTALAVGAGGGCLDIFSLIYHFSFSLSLGKSPI